MEKVWSVLSLSPAIVPELVKPAATLSRQRSASQRDWVAAANAVKAAEGAPMCVGEPKTIASAASSLAQPVSSRRSTWTRTAAAPACDAAPSATACASRVVWPAAE